MPRLGLPFGFRASFFQSLNDAPCGAMCENDESASRDRIAPSSVDKVQEVAEVKAGRPQKRGKTAASGLVWGGLRR